ncbi:uncharacterized protein HMPREF1541_07931 [Cyphellophora europaea CBS 101466]|uniref:Uncharacterized protein n=1 Tax=Cyphellophora europaea (strain CBS 101466) TaxID=1220924 RepID=W2RMJ8_CYPE1|nr:uncharacterized protein HMPREF1541_07931 [Cyphellophora europaea CBS 101466]ETN36944.1 hypothetical protein HMPREF1541_07931 [Cyphellophora europaea CBS 101466]
MTGANSPRFIVARYLQSQGYQQTLETFITETDLSPGAATTNPGDWDLEEIIKEKSLFDQNLNFEKDSAATRTGWSEPCPQHPSQPEGANLANGLAVTADPKSGSIIASFVNNTVGFWDTARPVVPTLGILSAGRNILSLAATEQFLLTSQMDGSVSIHDIGTFRTLATIKAHSSYAVQVVPTWDNGNLLVATAGWDKKISIHYPQIRDQPRDAEAAPSAITFPATFTTLSAPHNVQSLIFARHPDTSALYLIYTARDSIYLHYVLLTPNPATNDSHEATSTPYTATPAGRQSLAPQQHATWTSFTPSWIEACPTDPTLLAIATSHTPSMKLILARLLFPSATSTSTSNTSSLHPQTGTQDELAIKLVCTTSAPQNDYSTPRCAWRPDGSGVWVSGDDGVVRGVDAETGKVVVSLKPRKENGRGEGLLGHDPGSKIRALWAGVIGDEDVDDEGQGQGQGQGQGRREVLISAGFDRKVLIWEVGVGDGDGGEEQEG